MQCLDKHTEGGSGKLLPIPFWILIMQDVYDDSSRVCPHDVKSQPVNAPFTV